MKQIRALLLAGGLGTRLRPLTNDCPKCLVPIGGFPLLEHWLCALYRLRVDRVLINVHHHRYLVESFLERQQFKEWVMGVYEPELLGTAGTIRSNGGFFSSCTALVIHADNWCQCAFKEFLEFHEIRRPRHTLITMMTFRTDKPSSCGIIQTDEEGIVQQFDEKIENPKGNLANGAVYLLEPEVVAWISKRTKIKDFSREVVPNFLGQIATWENTEVHRDIGTYESLFEAQKDRRSEHCWPESDNWAREFMNNPIHKSLLGS